MNRWDPFSDNFRILERFGARFGEGSEDEGELDDGAATPAADVFEDREGLHIEVELPGVALRDVAVSLSSDAIIVEAERPLARGPERRVRHLEGRYGRMRRVFTLPLRAVPARAMAELRHGVLRIFVPRISETAAVTSRLDVRADESPVVVPID